MKITKFGTGYDGLVTGDYLAESGYQAICDDTDSAKVESLKKSGEAISISPPAHIPGPELPW